MVLETARSTWFQLKRIPKSITLQKITQRENSRKGWVKYKNNKRNKQKSKKN